MLLDMLPTRIFTPRDLGSRGNALNMIRLLLALAVLYSHAEVLSRTGDGVVWQGQHIGSWGVVGFFAISGFLITGSRLRSTAGKFLINRVARIFPGYIVVLIVVALGFGPVAQIIEKGTLDGYWGTGVTPLQYIWGNALLNIVSYNIGTTLSTSPYGQAWNGSLWSLYYEFWCYIIIGVLLSWSLTRRRAWPTVFLFLASAACHACIDRVSPYIGDDESLKLLIFMLPYFMGGAVVRMLHERLPMRAWMALASAVISYALIVSYPDFGKQLASPFIAYLVLWFGAVLPSPSIIKVHDISYGVYIFHFPVIQLLLIMGVAAHGFWLLLAMTVAITFVLATASWFGVERAAMRWSRGLKPWGDLLRRDSPADGAPDPAPSGRV